MLLVVVAVTLTRVCVGCVVGADSSDRAAAPAVPPPPAPVADEPLAVTFGDISTASYRIRKGVTSRAAVRSPKMSALCDMDVWYKKDFLLPTGRCDTPPRPPFVCRNT